VKVTTEALRNLGALWKEPKCISKFESGESAISENGWVAMAVQASGHPFHNRFRSQET